MTRRRLVVLGVVVAALAAAGVAGAYGYERSRAGVIAEGVTIGGVEVGGLDAAAAERRVGDALAAGMATPMVVQSVRSRFTLRRSDFGVRADVGRAVQEALARSRHGGKVARKSANVAPYSKRQGPAGGCCRMYRSAA